MNLWQRFWKKAQVLGRAYEVWVAVVFIGSLALATWKAMAGFPKVTLAAYYVAVFASAVLAILAPLLLLNIRRAARGEKLNPNLLVESASNDITIRRTGLRLIERKRLRATRSEAQIRFRVALTGTARLELRLISPGVLKGPVVSNAWNLYEVEMRRPLSPGDHYDLELEYLTSDPDSTMRPYVAEGSTRWAAYKALRTHIAFPEEAPIKVLRYCENLASGVANPESMKAVFLTKEGSASWEDPNIDDKWVYAVSWRWRERGIDVA